MSRQIPLAALIAAGALAAGASAAQAASTLYVSASASSDPACAAASQANPFATVGGALACATNGATIHVGAGSFHTEASVPVNVTIVGAGAATVLTGSTSVLDLTPVLTVTNGHTLTVKSLTIDGVDQNAQGIVAGAGKLTVANTTIENTGAHGPAYGAAIQVSGGAQAATVTVTGSTLANNTTNGGGGAISIDGGATATAASSTLVVTDSTLTGNAAGSTSAGGAIYADRANLLVRDSTIANNSASHGGGFEKTTQPGAVWLANTIVANNTASVGPDCDVPSGRLTDLGHNLIGSGCAGLVDEVNGDQVGTTASPIDPVLGPLAANGGQTQTRALLLGSPAINAGDPVDCQGAPVSNKDQRAKGRNTATRLACDIGAYDTGGKAPQTLHVSAKATSDPSCANAVSKPFKTLAAALACSSNGTTVVLGAGTFAGQVTISHNVVLRGAGPTSVIAGSTNPITAGPDITIVPRAVVILDSLTVDGVNAGPGVVSHSGLLLLKNATITRGGAIGANAADAGGLTSTPGPDTTAAVTVYDSTIDHNTTYGSGGGIRFDPAVSLTDTHPPVSTLAVLNSTIADNTANGNTIGGGGIYAGWAALTLDDSTVAGNSASPGVGGGIVGHAAQSATLTNTILAGNTAPSGADCVGDTMPFATSGGHNVIGQIGPDSGVGCQALGDNGVNGDQVGTPASPLNPMLGALASNGGPTQTMALQSGSPAISGGWALDALAWPISGRDQRGVSRNAKARGASDVGAYDTGGAAS